MAATTKRPAPGSFSQLTKKQRTTAQSTPTPPATSVEKYAGWEEGDEEWNGFSDDEEEWNGFSDDEEGQDFAGHLSHPIQNGLDKQRTPVEHPGAKIGHAAMLGGVERLKSIADPEIPIDEECEPAEMPKSAFHCAPFDDDDDNDDEDHGQDVGTLACTKLPWSLIVHVGDVRSSHPGQSNNQRRRNEAKKVIEQYWGAAADKVLDMELHPNFEDPTTGTFIPKQYAEWNHDLLIALSELCRYIERDGASIWLKQQVDSRLTREKELGQYGSSSQKGRAKSTGLRARDVHATIDALEKNGVKKGLVHPHYRKSKVEMDK